jgi:hypothetical protein
MNLLAYQGDATVYMILNDATRWTDNKSVDFQARSADLSRNPSSKTVLHTRQHIQQPRDGNFDN